MRNRTLMRIRKLISGLLTNLGLGSVEVNSSMVRMCGCKWTGVGSKSRRRTVAQGILGKSNQNKLVDKSIGQKMDPILYIYIVNCTA